MPSNDHPRWPELVEAIQAARVERGLVKRAEWAREARVDTSTLQIVEGLKPGNPSPEMLDKVTHVLGWKRGAWLAILEHGAQPSADPIRAASDVLLLSELLRRAQERQRAEAV